MPDTQPEQKVLTSPVSRQTRALARLRALLIERADEGQSLATDHETALANAQGRFDTATETAEETWKAGKQKAEADAAASHGQAKTAFETEGSAEARRHRAEKARKESSLADREETANQAMTDAESIADSSFEPALKAEEDALKRLKNDVRMVRESVDLMEGEAQRLAGPRVSMPPMAPMILGQTADGDLALPSEWRDRQGPPPLEVAHQKRDEVEKLVRKLGGITLHAAFRAGAPILLAFLAFLVGFFVTAIQLNWSRLDIPAGVAVGGVVVVLLLAWPLRILAFAGTKRRLRPIADGLREVRHLCDVSIAMAQNARREAETQLLDARGAEIQDARASASATLDAIRAERTRTIGDLDARHQSVMDQLKAARQVATERAEQERAVAIEDAERVYNEATREAREKLEAERVEIERDNAEAVRALAERFTTEARSLVAELSQITENTRSGAAAWDDSSWSVWSPPRTPAQGVPVGWAKATLNDLPSGLPTEPEEREGLTHALDIPALIGFPGDASLLVVAGDAQRGRALDTLRDAVLRLLTSMPPGKVRLTMFDPVGLGQSFAGFMRLSDHDERLVTNRIWTEARHLEQRLADLTEHMETVIQKYLRNEFDSIEAYNDAAGEIAEPYRFLVIADLPEGLTEEAGRRLASVIESGPRCGVYTLIHLDPDRSIPETIERETLERASCVVTFDDDGVARVAGDAYEGLAFDLETPQAESESAKLLDQVGREGLDAGRVEVPFRLLGPQDGRLWSESCADELRVPLGRAGATRFQQLALGKGTSQHVLIAGKTGSGKSTLLHVLIANAARWLSPDELELYLVDFKKGVEFKAYAQDRLPHAKVVAVESDREFGLSALKRLDEELKHRGDLFRDLGAQSIGAARDRLAERGDTTPMPRVLLIIDEFQEFFTEDDQIAQEASLLLDRLVRQGRAFGMHVLLGSQTLSGAYSLARSTVGQMAVRIALQCSETDSYLILSEDNGAARLLNRPGEAIYNDANGLSEGNSPFQIAWLSDEQRDETLDRVLEKVKETGWKRREPQIVFEGNAPAGLERNYRLLEALETPLESARASSAWLGEPVAIKDHTAAVLRRQSGSNALIVGQQPEVARAMLAAALVGLVAQHAGDAEAEITVIDTTPPDDPEAEVLSTIAQKLANASGLNVRCVGPRHAADVITSLEDERASRDASDRTDAPARHLLVNGLQRLKALRKVEDDFSFSFSASEEDASDGKSTADAFGDLLREGPALGLFTVAWCDSVTGLNRSLDRRAVTAFEQRVAMQMSAADSSTLIDSGAAAKLGLHRALLYNEELGTLEKFRPYAVPDDGFVETVANALRR
ncbi:MAG: FtsK/SpoIIIE domain-containing protein [Planctomycetota bacterium]